MPGVGIGVDVDVDVGVSQYGIGFRWQKVERFECGLIADELIGLGHRHSALGTGGLPGGKKKQC